MAKRRRRTRKTAARKPTRRSRRPAKSARKSARKSAARTPRRRTRAATRKAARRRAPTIDLDFKGLAFAAEPPRDNDPASLDLVFRTKLDAVLAEMASRGTPFKFVEGFRTTERQQWLFGSGRPSAVPFGRAGKIVTQRDGVRKRSNHQGNGTTGSGKAADCYPLANGRVHIPPASDPVWRAYADAAIRQGLQAGLNFPTLKDAPHCELA